MNKSFIYSLTVCSRDKYDQILRIIKSLGSAKYGVLGDICAGKDKRALFAHRLRKLKALGVVGNNNIGKLYSLTEKGLLILKTLDDFKTHYISEDQEQICEHGKDLTHEYVIICKRCGEVKEWIKN